MPRYRSYGNLDNPHATDGDVAFVRWVSRINPEQLQAGEVNYSQNGRMDNDRTWQPRNGLSVFSPALNIESTLNFPFAYDDSSPPTYDDGVINGVYGAGYFVDPVTGAGYIMIVTNNKVILINIGDPTTGGYYLRPDGSSLYVRPGGGFYTFDSRSEVTYPGGITIDSPVEIIQALDKVFVFRDGQNALIWDGDLSGSLVFAEASDTATTVSVDDGASNTVVTDGLVEVTKAAHGRSTGDIVKIYDAGASNLTVGDKYEITVVDVDTYTFKAEIADGTFTVTLGGKQPLSGGYIAMPDPAWGVFHEGRLIVPYQRNLETGVSRDEIVFSDIFDTDTYDPILNQFRFASGSADYVVGVSPLLDNRLIVFNRRSIHLLDGVRGSLDDAQQTEITREIGCIARKRV